MSASKYKKLSPIDHVLLRPEMYVGSVESQPTPMFLFDPASQKMIWTTAPLNHGFLKIFDEILLNAADNIQNSKREAMTYIAVTVDRGTGVISVENDGAGIPVVLNKEHKLLVPEMIFGHLLTSSNYDNDPDSVAAGRHGYGAKLTNIMSHTFEVHCKCKGKEVTLSWSDHMRQLAPYTIKNCSPTSNVTRITYAPDLSVFGMTSFTEEMYQVLLKRAMDLAASFPQVTVRVNGETMHFSSFAKYAELYLPMAPPSPSDEVKFPSPFVFESKVCRLAFVPCQTPAASRRFFSVVNGVVTHSGGSHVTAANDVLSAAVDALASDLKASRGLILTTTAFVRHFVVIVFVTTPQPKFDSQSKVRLVSSVKLPRIPSSDLAQFLSGMPFIEGSSKSAMDTLAKEINQLVPSGKKRTPMISALSKLVDAASAGSRADVDRTLIVTEGDSAKALALNSLSNDQRKTFGVFPLRGKLLNVRNNNIARLKRCKELCELFAALGLELGRKPVISDLRYQRVLIMTDQDADGTHIKGLLISAFESLWPELLHAHPGFLSVFSTPLIRATTRGGDVVSFYSKKEFVTWSAKNPHLAAQCQVKYYKGLGTSTTEEGKAYFRDMSRHVMQVMVTKEDRPLLDNVFAADEVQWRKDWLTSQAAVDELDVDRSLKSIDITSFIEKELIHFAVAGNLRALPSAVDGLKPSQRKILWSCFKRNLTASVKVAQLSGYVSEVSAFHHGEMSLQQTIVKMAQDFTGSNNVNTLLPEGQFGSRQHLGSDHAAARYIFTRLSPLSRLLFPAHDDDLLVHVEDEGRLVEPKFYVPIIPMLLVNGSVGIGFGFASTVQPHHPLDVVTAVRRMIRGQSAKDAIADLRPWSIGFGGTLRADESGEGLQYSCVGRYSTRSVKGLRVIRVEELPWNTSVEYFRTTVGRLAENGKVLRFADYSGANHVDADIVISNDSGIQSQRDVEATFGLVSNVCNNACVYSPAMVLTPLQGDLSSIAQWHYECRLSLYERRKASLLDSLRRRLSILKSTHKFSEHVRSGAVDFRKVTEDDLNALCSTLHLKRDPETDSYDYLLRRPISYFTNTNSEKLLRDIAKCESDVKALERKSPTDLWEEDLAAFEAAFMLQEQRILEQIEADRRKRFAVPEVAGLEQSPNDREYSRRLPPKAAPGGCGGSGGDGMVVTKVLPLAAAAPTTNTPNHATATVVKCVHEAQKVVGRLSATLMSRALRTILI